MKASRAFGILLVVLMGWSGIAFSQKWRALTNQPSFGANIPLLLANGDVLVQEDNPGNWSRLTPDQFGSYVNGTWKRAASLPPGYGPPPGYGGPPPRQCAQWAYDYNGNRVCTAFY